MREMNAPAPLCDLSPSPRCPHRAGFHRVPWLRLAQLDCKNSSLPLSVRPFRSFSFPALFAGFIRPRVPLHLRVNDTIIVQIIF